MCREAGRAGGTPCAQGAARRRPSPCLLPAHAPLPPASPLPACPFRPFPRPWTFLQGTGAQRLGLVAQQVRQVMERHGAEGLNVVKASAQASARNLGWKRLLLSHSAVQPGCCACCALRCQTACCACWRSLPRCTPPPLPSQVQGTLSIDFSALQTLMMSALQRVLADAAELRRSQGAFQLAVLGRLEALAAAQQAEGGGLQVLLQGGSRLGGKSRGGDSPRGVFDDEEEVSEGSEEEWREAEGELRDTSEAQAAEWLMARLSEQAGARGISKVSTARGLQLGWVGLRKPGRCPLLCRSCPAAQDGLCCAVLGAWHHACFTALPPLPLPQKLAGDLSRAALWECYREALSAPPELIADGSQQRSLGGQFIKLAKKRVQAEKMR